MINENQYRFVLASDETINTESLDKSLRVADSDIKVKTPFGFIAVHDGRVVTAWHLMPGRERLEAELKGGQDGLEIIAMSANGDAIKLNRIPEPNFRWYEAFTPPASTR